MSSTHNKVVISSLELMEHIVDISPRLEWEGWDVIKYDPQPVSFMNPKGRFRNGKWHLVERYPINERGWVVPRSWLRDLA